MGQYNHYRATIERIKAHNAEAIEAARLDLKERAGYSSPLFRFAAWTGQLIEMLGFEYDGYKEPTDEILEKARQIAAEIKRMECLTRALSQQADTMVRLITDRQQILIMQTDAEQAFDMLTAPATATTNTATTTSAQGGN